MFITTTLGGLVVAISVGMAIGSVAGALVRPHLDRARGRFLDAAHRVMRRNKHDVDNTYRNPSAGP
jgi:hypothetical protein